jgi:hypothetical protein
MTKTTEQIPPNERKWGGLINELLWMCAGVNRRILLKCPEDWTKYAGQGGLILFTALMAMLSGGYAFFTIFDDIYLSIFFGIFWGLLIFNLDRFIVNTMYSDGKYTISRMEFLAGLPRLVIAVFIGIVISTPLEMKIFEDRIESQIVKDNAKRTEETRRQAQYLYDRLEQLKKEESNLVAERRVHEFKKAEADRELADEEAGIASGKIGRGPIWRAKKEYADICVAAIEEYDNTIRIIKNRIETDIENTINDIKQFEIDIKDGQEDKGFCVRYEAFANVKEENSSVAIVSIFIMLLFIIIEVAPTLFKMMVASGPYDDMLNAARHKTKVLSQKIISDINDDINTHIQISVEKNKNKLEAEAAANKELLEKIASIQAELLTTAIKEWKKLELKRIKQNPTQYIKSNTSS